MNGNKVIGTLSLSYGVPYSMDTEISLPRPESWSKGVLGETFSEGNERITGMRDSNIQHTDRPYTHGNDNSAEICSKCSGGKNKGNDK